jgi:hypothetical protein
MPTWLVYSTGPAFDAGDEWRRLLSDRGKAGVAGEHRRSIA